MEIELDRRPRATETLAPASAELAATENNPFLRMGGLLRAAALSLRYQLVLSGAVLGSIFLAAVHAPIAALVVIAAGFGLYGGMVARDWSRRRWSRDRWLEHPLELTSKYRSEPGGSGLLEQIVNCHEAIRCHVASTDPWMRPSLDEIFSECTDLVFEAARLEKQVANLRVYLSGTRRSALEREHAELLKLADNTESAEARDQLEAAARRKREQIELYKEIQALDDRGRSRIRLIKATLDSVRTRLVKLRARQREAGAAARFSVTERIDALNRSVCDLDFGVTEVFDQ